MTHEPGHEPTLEELAAGAEGDFSFLFPGGPQPGPFTIKEHSTDQGVVEVLIDADGAFVQARFRDTKTKTGVVTALGQVSIGRGYILQLLSGGENPILIPPSSQPAEPRQFNIEGSSKVVIVTGSNVQIVEKDQAPVFATQVGDEILSDGTLRLHFADGSHKDTPPTSDAERLQFVDIPGNPNQKIVVLGGSFQTVNTSDVSKSVQQPTEFTAFGQNFLFNPNTGGFQRVDPPVQRFDPGVVTEGGRTFTRDAQGNLTPLGREEIPNLDEMINARILAGDASGALALADFRDRPTSLEAFNAAMQFAQSPGDVAAISAISRGQSLVAPPPTGTVQRIAEQPEFLQDAFQRLMNQFRGGTGTPGEFMDVLTRINKEAAQSKAQLEQASEKNRTLEQNAAIEKALAPFRTQISNLEKQLAVGTGGPPPTTPPPVVPPTTTTSPLEDQLKELFLSGAPVSGVISDLVEFGITSNPEDLLAQWRAEAGIPPTAPTVPTGTEGIPVSDPIQPPTTTPPTTTTPLPVSGGDPIQPPGTVSEPSPLPVSGGDPIQPAPTTSPTTFGETFDQGEDDFFKHGGVFDDRTALVGEAGPEIIVAAPGTRVMSLGGGKKAKSAAERLRKAGMKGMQEGGIVEPLLPFGVRRALSGGTIEPTRRRLSTAAGLSVLSAQARQNLLPEELDVFARLSREAGIPEGAFEQEQRSAFPGANLARRQSRFAARVRG